MRLCVPCSGNRGRNDRRPCTSAVCGIRLVYHRMGSIKITFPADTAENSSIVQFDGMGFVIPDPRHIVRFVQYAQSFPCCSAVTAFVCGDTVFFQTVLCVHFFSEIQERTVPAENRSMRSGYGNLYGFSSGHPAVVGNPDKGTAVAVFFRNGWILIQHTAGTVPAMPDCIAVFVQIDSGRMGEPAYKQGAAA